MNYFQIHKNKKPKKLKKNYLNPRKVKANIIVAMGSVQIEIIKSQAFTDLNQKKLAIAEQVLNTANAVKILWSPKQKYLDRINQKQI